MTVARRLATDSDRACRLGARRGLFEIGVEAEKVGMELQPA